MRSTLRPVNLVRNSLRGLHNVRTLLPGPRPEVVVVITDGHTPWPDTPPRGMKVVVVLHGDGQAPEWAKVIRREE